MHYRLCCLKHQKKETTGGGFRYSDHFLLKSYLSKIKLKLSIIKKKITITITINLLFVSKPEKSFECQTQKTKSQPNIIRFSFMAIPLVIFLGGRALCTLHQVVINQNAKSRFLFQS